MFNHKIKSKVDQYNYLLTQEVSLKLGSTSDI